MKILLLSPFFYPEAISTGKYNTVLAEGLVKSGVEVYVVCSHPLYPTWKPTRSDKQLKQMRIIRGGAAVRYPRSVLFRRMVLEIWYACHVIWTLCWKRFRPDIVLVVFPPTFFFSLVSFFFLTKVRRVGIVHDLQSTLGFRKDNFLHRCLRCIVRSIDQMSFRACDSLIVLSNAMASVVRQDYGVPADRVVVAYPFVTITGQKESTEMASVMPDGLQHVVYSGALGSKQNPRGLFEFFRTAAIRLNGVCFHIFSDGPIFQEFRKLHDRNGFQGLALHPLVDEANLRELYSRSTVQVIPQLDGTSSACLPSKLPNILASGCLVLAICDHDSELAKIVGKFSGKVVSTWNPDALLEGLQSLLQTAKHQSAHERCSLASPFLSEHFSVDSVISAVLGTSPKSALSKALQTSSSVAPL